MLKNHSTIDLDNIKTTKQPTRFLEKHVMHLQVERGQLLLLTLTSIELGVLTTSTKNPLTLH